MPEQPAIPRPARPSDHAARRGSLTPAARLLRPQGRRGELLAEPLTDLPDLFANGLRVFVAGAVGADPLETAIESCWSPTGRNAGRIVLKLSGVDSISAAELLAGRDLLLDSGNLPALDPDTWFVGDLVGCELFDGETLVGEIAAVEHPMAPDGRTRLADAAPLLAVILAVNENTPSAEAATESAGEQEPALIPFIKAWLESVDIAQRRVVMHLPAGLLELEHESE
jgi:16S rRNA processing protein RimM